MDKSLRGDSPLFTLLVVAFTLALVISNVIAGKLWQTPIPGIILTAGEWLFPIVYIIDDVVPEVYGLQKTRRLIWIGFGANLFAVIFYSICIALPYPDFWENQSSFQTVLGFAPRLLLASFVAYLVGTNVNAWIMVKMKALTKGKWLWTRTITSTIFGEGIDSTLFGLIAFYGMLSGPEMFSLIISMAVFKTTYEILVTPLTYIAVDRVRAWEETLMAPELL